MNSIPKLSTKITHIHPQKNQFNKISSKQFHLLVGCYCKSVLFNRHYSGSSNTNNKNNFKKHSNFRNKKVSNIKENLIDAKRIDDILNCYQKNHSTFTMSNNIAALKHIGMLLNRNRYDRTQRFETSNPIFQRLYMKIKVNIATMDPHLLSMSLNSLSKLPLMKDVKFYNDIESRITETVTMFRPINLALTVNAYAKLNIKSAKVFKCISKEILVQIEDFNAQDLANILNAYAKLDIKSEKVFKCVENEIPNKIKDFTPQALANTVNAYAKLDIKSEKVFKCVENEIPHKIKYFDAQALANTVNAYAKLDIKSEKVFKCVENEIPHKIKDFTPQNLANTLNAYTLMKKPKVCFDLLVVISEYVVVDNLVNDISIESLYQMHQCFMELALRGYEVPNKYENIKTFMKNKVIDENYIGRDLKSSKLHQSISLNLKTLLGLKHENEFITNEGYSVDIKVDGMWKDSYGIVKQLCIEVDGPSHFYSDRTMTSSTLMKHRHLRGFGWHVISIPYWEWNKCKSNKNLKKSYLESQLCSNYELQ